MLFKRGLNLGTANVLSAWSLHDLNNFVLWPNQTPISYNNCWDMKHNVIIA